MTGPAILSDPSVGAIAINVISTGISAGLSKVKKRIFSPQDITGYLNFVGFRERLEQEIEFEEVTTTDLKNLETFILDKHVIDLISQIYDNSDKSRTEIENEFVQIFCEIKPMGERSTDALARKLFFGIKLAADETLLLLIKQDGQGSLLAHEYKSQERYKEVLEKLEKCEQQDRGNFFPFQVQPGIVSSYVPNENIDAELKGSLDLINTHQFEKAKTKLFEAIGLLENATPKNKSLLSKTYHLLAVAYNRNKEIGGNFDSAEYYAQCSLRYDATYDKAEGCLASVLINKQGKENYVKSLEISESLWENSDKTNPQFLEVYLWGICLTKSVTDAITFFKSSAEAQLLVEQNSILSSVIARFYLITSEPRASLDYIDNSIRLGQDQPDYYAIKGMVYHAISSVEDWINSDFELCPRLKKTDTLENAVKNYQKCISLYKEGRDNIYLREKSKKELYCCLIILDHTNKNEIYRIRETINPSYLPEEEQKSLYFFDFLFEFNCRNFSTAYNLLVNFSEWDKFPYQTKLNIARIFLKRGCPEESRKILKLLELDTKNKKDLQICVTLSFVEALLGNKTGLLQQLEISKRESKDSHNEESTFTHIYAMINRYRDGGKEIDRMLACLQEHDKKFPEQKLLKAIPIGDDKENPPGEIIDIYKKAFEREQNLKKVFTEHQVPSYILADVNRLTYPEFMSRLKDPTFHLRYYPPDKYSQQELTNNFDSSKEFVFDYSSLLNLAKMDLLWELEKIPGKILIPLSLFSQIQSDLVYYENPDLRRLWNFIRLSGVISIIEVDIAPNKYEDLLKYVNRWIVDSFELVSLGENSALLSDDYNLIRLIKSQKCNGTTSLIFLKFLVEREFIDSKTYGVALGVLADQLYIILPYSEEDLWYIATDDDCKIRLRSYHLINHITIPEVISSIYSRQIVYFIDKLWGSGALFEDKLNWMMMITERMLFAINQRCGMSQMCEASLLSIDLKTIWGDVITLCDYSELKTLEEKCGPLFEKDRANELIKFLLSLINERKSVLSPQEPKASEKK
jgi:hypothetical protein